MEFDGFSSDESESDSLPPPLPPDPDSAPLGGTVAVEPAPEEPAPEEPAPAEPATEEPAPAESAPTCEVKSRGGALGGGRTPLQLPRGCKAFLIDSGLENFACVCKVIFTEKKNLLRHFQDCQTGIPTLHPTKRRKLGFSISESESPKLNENREFEEDDTSTSASYFNEDEEGTQLLQCK